MTPLADSTETTRLDSWKEIAKHLGRDVRTAIRWERDRGLPVHRLPGGRRSAVFAYRAEIDGWLRGRPEVAHAASADTARAVSSGPMKGRRLSVRQLAGAGLLLVVVAATGVWASHIGRGGASFVPQVDRLELEDWAVVARSSDGALLWRFATPARVRRDVIGSAASPWNAIADLDGDGRPEAIASVPLSATGDAFSLQDELYVFSSTGSVLWRQRLTDQLTFRGGTFGPPWGAGHVAVYRAGGQVRIAWSQAHRLWWPSMLVTLDPVGRRLGTFVHSGSIRALRVEEASNRPAIVIGGVANAFRAAFLAVVDGSSVAGHGPVPAGSPYECLDCAPGGPLRYFLFPPSDICSANGNPYNTINYIVVGDAGDVEVHTRESDSSIPTAEMIFRFSLNFELLDARSADSWRAHEVLERAGKLDHNVASCPWYRNPPPVREWNPSGRWVDLHPVAGPSPKVAQH
jgi:hypothetical protein